MKSAKQVRGYLFNIAQQFGASCEYILYLIQTHQLPNVRINLLNAAIEPAALAEPRNTKLASITQESFNRLIKPVFENGLKRAELIVILEQNRAVITVTVETLTNRNWQSQLIKENPLICGGR